MKKKILFVIFAVMLVFITGCGKKGYTEISYNKLKEMMDNKETFTLFIGRESCSSCSVFKGILNDAYTKSYIKEATIYYIDTDKLNDAEDKEFHTKFSYGGTPCITIIVDGKFTPLNSVEGSNSYNAMIDLMKSKGILKGGENTESKEEEKQDEVKQGYEEISYNTLNQKTNNGETFALFIGRESCSACTIFKGILNNSYAKEYAKEATIYYIDTDKLTDNEYAEFNSKYSYTATPTITIIVNGKFSTLNSVEGTGSYSDMIDMMKNKGLLR